MWSLGCILYALWCGDSPFAAESDALVVDLIRSFAAEQKTTRLDSFPNQCWRNLLENSLLQINPQLRSGLYIQTTTAATATKQQLQQQPSVFYPFLCGHPVFSQETSLDPVFLPPKPSWLQQVEQGGNNNNTNDVLWRDGSLGWTAFLI